MKEIYQQTKGELFKEYGDPGGLTTRRAQELLEKYGENLLREKKKRKVYSAYFWDNLPTFWWLFLWRQQWYPCFREMWRVL